MVGEIVSSVIYFLFYAITATAENVAKVTWAKGIIGTIGGAFIEELVEEIFSEPISKIKGEIENNEKAKNEVKNWLSKDENSVSEFLKKYEKWIKRGKVKEAILKLIKDAQKNFENEEKSGSLDEFLKSLEIKNSDITENIKKIVMKLSFKKLSSENKIVYKLLQSNQEEVIKMIETLTGKVNDIDKYLKGSEGEFEKFIDSKKDPEKKVLRNALVIASQHLASGITTLNEANPFTYVKIECPECKAGGHYVKRIDNKCYCEMCGEVFDIIEGIDQYKELYNEIYKNIFNEISENNKELKEVSAKNTKELKSYINSLIQYQIQANACNMKSQTADIKSCISSINKENKEFIEQLKCEIKGDFKKLEDQISNIANEKMKDLFSLLSLHTANYETMSSMILKAGKQNEESIGKIICVLKDVNEKLEKFNDDKKLNITCKICGTKASVPILEGGIIQCPKCRVLGNTNNNNSIIGNDYTVIEMENYLSTFYNGTKYFDVGRINENILESDKVCCRLEINCLKGQLKFWDFEEKIKCSKMVIVLRQINSVTQDIEDRLRSYFPDDLRIYDIKGGV